MIYNLFGGMLNLALSILHCNINTDFITALHEMQRRYSDENSVRLSVRHTRDPWQNGRKIGPDFYTIRRHIYPSFLRRRMVGGGRPLQREIWGQPTPVGAKSPIFNNIGADVRTPKSKNEFVGGQYRTTPSASLPPPQTPIFGQEVLKTHANIK